MRRRVLTPWDRHHRSAGLGFAQTSALSGCDDSAARGDAAFPTAGTMFVRIFLLVPRFLVFLSTHCGQSHALFALRRSIQPAAIASARLPEPEPESNQAVRASPTCEGLSHVSSIVSRPSPIPKIFTPIICKPFSMKGALDTNPAGFHSDNCHKKSLLGLWHKSCAFVHRKAPADLLET